MKYTQGDLIKSRFATKVLQKYPKYDLIQLKELLDILDDIGIPELYEALMNLIVTASYLWNIAKPIKDTDAMTVTHPIIEQAKQALAKADGK